MKSINEAKAVPTRFTLKAATLLATTTKSEESARKAAQAAYDRMVSDNMFWTDWLPVKAEGSTATPELREALFAARRKGFGAWATKLYATPNKALSEDQIAKKSKLRTDLNSKITHDKEAMRLRLDPEYRASKSKATTKAPQTPTGAPAKQVGVTKEVELLNRIVKIYQGKVSPEYDIVELGKLLAKALQVINTPFEPNH